MTERDLDLFGRCPACGATWDAGDGTSRVLGREDPDVYDGVWEWVCPSCQAVFPRFDVPRRPSRRR